MLLTAPPPTLRPVHGEEPYQTEQPEAPASADTSLTFREYSGGEIRKGLDCWRDLQQRLPDCGVTCSADWIEIWLRHYGSVTRPRIIVAEAGERLCGAALLSAGAGRKAGPIPVRSLHLGTAGEPAGDSFYVEYNRFLCDRPLQGAFVRGLLDLVRRDPDWERFDLDGFELADAQPLLDAAPGACLEVRDSLYFDLARARAERREPVEYLGRSSRSNIRRRLRQYGELQTEWADTPSHAASIFDELIELHQSRWQSAGGRGAFSSARFLSFQRELLERLAPQRRIVLFRARSGGQTIGCQLLLVDRGDLLDYLSGHATFAKFSSPGVITHYLCIEEAVQRGYDRYDFLAGEKRHKRDLSTGARKLVWAAWKRPTWKNRLIAAACNLKRRLRSRGRSE